MQEQKVTIEINVNVRQDQPEPKTATTPPPTFAEVKAKNMAKEYAPRDEFDLSGRSTGAVFAMSRAIRLIDILREMNELVEKADKGEKIECGDAESRLLGFSLISKAFIKDFEGFFKL